MKLQQHLFLPTFYFKLQYKTKREAESKIKLQNKTKHEAE